jgi:hypothetical protein
MHLSAHLALWQHNFKYARALLRRVVNLPAGAGSRVGHAVVYAAHLALIGLLCVSSATSSTSSSTTSSPNTTPKTKNHTPNQNQNQNQNQNLPQALSALRTLESLSQQNGHSSVTLLTRVLRLRVLVHFGRWGETGAGGKIGTGTRTGIGEGEGMGEALEACERDLGIDFPTLTPTPTSTPTKSKSKTPTKIETATTTTSDLDAHLRLTVLTLGVLYHTHHGRAREARDRRGGVHALFDRGVFESGGAGWVEVSFLSLSLSLFLFPRVTL